MYKYLFSVWELSAENFSEKFVLAKPTSSCVSTPDEN